MTTYTIDAENNITAFGSAKDAEAGAQGESFTTQQELTDLASNWPTAGLVEVWNGISGLTPVKVHRSQVRHHSDLEGHSEPQREQRGRSARTHRDGGHGGPETANKAKHAAKAKPTKGAEAKPAKPAKPGRKTATTAASVRDGSKKAPVLGLLQRKNGRRSLRL